MSHVLEEQAGTITVTSSALAEIVLRSAESTDGARVRRGRRHLEVDIAGGGARVTLRLVARRGLVLPELARAVQERVADSLTAMCGLRVEAVDVSLEEVE